MKWMFSSDHLIKALEMIKAHQILASCYSFDAEGGNRTHMPEGTRV